eukprot:Pgem_evm1s18106
MINIDLLCIITLMGLSINIITYIGLAIAVGLSVDYCIHLVLAFKGNKDESRKQRTILACEEIAGSILTGAFSTFFGIIIYVIAVALGIVHALTLLPIILA